MQSVTVSILYALIARSFARNLAANPSNDTQASMDKLAAKLVDTLIDRVTTVPINGADMDQTTLAKAHPDSSLGKPLMSRGVTSVFSPPRSASSSPSHASGWQAGGQMQPAAAAFASPLRSSSPLVRSQPNVRGALTSVHAVQDTLRAYGFASSPMEKLALTAIAATRDVSMRAQIKPAFMAMDATSRRKVVALAEGVIEMAKEISPEAAETAAEESKKEEEVKLKPQDLAGITAPTGYFDPLGFTTGCSAGTLLFYREAELKHGRVGMLASLGMLVAEKFHPLFGGNIDVPAYKAFQETPLQTFWPAVLLAVGALEYVNIQKFEQPFDESTYAIETGWQMKSDRIPGDLGFDPLGLKPKDPKEFTDLQNKELNNGRLAMLAAAGMLAQELVTGQKLF